MRANLSRSRSLARKPAEQVVEDIRRAALATVYLNTAYLSAPPGAAALC